jgi:hypothetical protein
MLQRSAQNSRRGQKARTITGHGKFVRGYRCVIGTTDCSGKIEAAHLDFAGGKGVGIKVHDAFMIPFCQHHHGEQHRIGWPAFRRTYGLTEEDLLATARDLARVSPSIVRAAMAAGHDVGIVENEI